MAQQPDRITVPPPSKSEPHSPGTNVFFIVDVVGLGPKLITFPGNPDRVQPVVAIVFASGETNSAGQLVTVQKEFTLSVHAKAALRIFLQQWYGKQFTDADLRNGFELSKLIAARPAMLTIQQKESQGGNLYAKVINASAMPKALMTEDVKALQQTVLAQYTRAPYWAETRKKYADEVSKYMGRSMDLTDVEPPPTNNDSDDLPPEDEDDDLPC
jgi:hypothetical protein